MTDNERKESISVLRQLLAMCDFVDQYGDPIDADPYFNAVETAIESLNETRWIPVAERLPENIGRYIVTLKDIWAITVRVAVYGVMPQDTHNKKVFWLYDSCNDDLDITEDVVAWMPLPAPYKAESEKV